MKNKIINFFLIITFFLGCYNHVSSNEFIFESEYIEITNDGNAIEAKNGVKIISDNKIEITANKSFYNKLTSDLLLEGNVVIIDIERNIKILSQEATYNKTIEKITAKGKVSAYLANNYTLYSKNLEYFKKDKVIRSKFKSTLIDKFDNKIITSNFKYSDNNKLFHGKMLQ